MYVHTYMSSHMFVGIGLSLTDQMSPENLWCMQIVLHVVTNYSTKTLTNSALIHKGIVDYLFPLSMFVGSSGMCGKL